MENNQKGFVNLFVIFVIILLIGGGVYVYVQKKQVSKPAIDNSNTQVISASVDVVTPTSTTQISKSQTADLKKYSDKIIGLQLLYPSTWIYPTVHPSVARLQHDPYIVDIGNSFEIQYFFSTDTIDKLASDSGINKEVVTVGGRKGIKFYPISENAQPNTQDILVQLSNNRIVQITYNQRDTHYNQIVKMIETIVFSDY